MDEMAVVLTSGGLDSTTLLAQCLDDGLVCVGMSFRYGSKHEAAEGRAAKAVCEYYSVPLYIIEVPPFPLQGSGCALLGERETPHGSYKELGPAPTVVPFRNGVFLAMAVAFASAHGIKYVYGGMHSDDGINWAYPDCRPEFLRPFADAALAGTYGEVRCVFPFVFETKADIVRRAKRLEAPLGLTWSCYDPQQTEPGFIAMPGSLRVHPVWKQCGECPTCIDRIAAFRANGLIDPVPYAIAVSWEGCEPWPVK